MLELNGIWEFICEGIGDHVFEFQLAHPLNAWAITEASVKAYKVDARTLARLLRLDMVPRSYVRPGTFAIRGRKCGSSPLVQRYTSFKNRIHTELTRNGLRRPMLRHYRG